MERTIFAFIWKHSWRQQFLLLGVTILSFPFLYASLELPKRIINDAIGGGDGPRGLFGIDVTQLQFLAVLCGGFLLAVLGQGLMKMQVNTLKGVLAERLLRRFRYTLINRILRFPQRYFRRTSQGELVSMVTAEAEPLGGIMGDLVAQPVFQGGMMATIVTFLFVQNPWLGLAAVALIPLQAWLIPMLQRRINLLNKDRVREVRRLAEQIGENAAGVGALRVDGGWRLKLAEVTARLGTLYQIRYRIYRQKYFMKFINNFITQLTPFFFFSIGGYLAITGDLTVGALVAALAAYKDLSAPWKELLTWYNQTQDMGLRWKIITERFAPEGVIDPALFEGEPAHIPHLDGPLTLENVSVRDGDGGSLLEGLNLEIPPGSMVAITSKSATERRALAELLAREVVPSSGRVSIGGQDLAGLHQGVIARRIGLAGPQPYLFSGSIGENITMGLLRPPTGDSLDSERRAMIEEARRAGNSADAVGNDWLSPEIAGVGDAEALSDWWMQLTEVMGTDEFLFDRGLDARFDPSVHPQLAERLVDLRPEIDRRIKDAGLCKAVHRFETDRFNDGLPVAGNLLFATPSREISQVDLARDQRFQTALESLGLCEDLFTLGRSVLATLVRVFGPQGTDHPLFRDLGIDADLYARLAEIEAKSRGGHDALDINERRLLLTVPFRFAAEQIGESFPDKLKDKILRLRATRMAEMRDMVGGVFVAIDPGQVASGLTVMENAIYGKPVLATGGKAAKLRKLVGEVLLEAGLKRLVAELIYDVETTIGGSNLPAVAHERIGFVRAAIKRPDILILDTALPSHDREKRLAMRGRLREALPDAMLIFLEEDFTHRDSFDLFVEIEDGRIVSDDDVAATEDDPATAGLMKKIRLLEKTELFAGLERRQIRLLAFGARWVEAERGEALFQTGEAPDGAYLFVKGRAELRWPEWVPGDVPVTVVEPGRVVGDLSVMLSDPRRVDMVATEPVKALRIEATVLRRIVEADAAVATSLLRTVSSYLIEVGGRLREERRGNRIDAPVPANVVPAQ